jgi:ferredoxin-NADP reductase
VANPVKTKVLVESVEKFGEGTYELSLKPSGRVPRFKAGQFLHLTVDEYDPAGGFWPESRVFSIASRNGAESLKIVYSVKGRYTKLMAERLRPGLEVWAKLPYGDFTIDARVKEGADVVLVAGGTGISPFIPYLEDLAEGAATSRRVRLYYGIRDASQLLFKDTLARCVSSSALELRLWLESDESEPAGLSDIKSKAGRLNVAAIHEECSELAAPNFFLSGPPAMIASFKSGLLSRGLGIDKIHIDEWE